jgi:hypothetical protein
VIHVLKLSLLLITFQIPKYELLLSDTCLKVVTAYDYVSHTDIRVLSEQDLSFSLLLITATLLSRDNLQDLDTKLLVTIYIQIYK